MLLIAGLGNPGKEYEDTRHNIGFMVIDALVDALKPANATKASFKGDLYKKENILLLKPMTFMNLSGDSILSVAHFYKVKDILVVHDELDLSFGTVRYKTGGSNGGHNGLKSIDARIGTEYKRARIGISKPPIKSMVADYVLSRFSDEESIHLTTLIKDVSQSILEIIRGEKFELVVSKRSGKRI